MSYLSILLVSFFATLSLASPAARQTTQCPQNGLSNTGNFTLFSVCKANNTIQQPLALGLNGYSSPSTETFLGLAESITQVVGQTFGMKDNGITAYNADGKIVGLSQNVASDNGLLSFVLSYGGLDVKTAEIYCVSPNAGVGSPFLFTLAVNGGDSDNFWVCQSTASGEVVVVYKATEEGSQAAGFYWTTCKPVFIAVFLAW